MKKIWIGLAALVLAFVLTACSNEKDEVEGVNEDFNDLVDGAEEELEKAQLLVDDYVNQVMSEEDYEVEKEEMFAYFDGLKEDLDDIKEPSSDRAQEYYNISYDVVDIMITISKDLLEIPDMTDFAAVEEYQTDLMANLESLGAAVEEVTDFQDELIEEDEDYKEVFEED